MKNLLTFFEIERNARKAKFIGFVGALCALFLTIDQPPAVEARNALAVVQVFWLGAVTLGLTSIFFDLVKYVWVQERTLNQAFDITFNFIFSGAVAVVLGGVIINVWIYMLSLYVNIFAIAIVMFGFPLLVVILCMLGAILAKTFENRMPVILLLVLESLIVSALATISGFYLEFAITKVFQSHWFYPFLPGIALVFLTIATAFSLYRGKDLLKPWSDQDEEPLTQVIPDIATTER